MKIQCIQSNIAYNNDCNKRQQNPAFSARVPEGLKNTILTHAVELGTEGLNKAKKQISNVERWGSPMTYLESAFDFSSNTQHLGAGNLSISKMYGAGFKNQKGNLYDTFMSLKEKDIIDAEQQIVAEVGNNKADLIKKAIQNSKLMKKITGEVNPSDEKLAAMIDKLSEEEIVNLRFNLDEPSKFSQGPTLDFDF